MIPYGRQEITQDDIDAVTAVLRSDFLTQGPTVPRFESAVSAYCGAEHAVATNSATSALHIACLALGLGPGDWLWTSPISFVASANCGLYCGAQVDFVDIDARTHNLDPKALEAKLIDAERHGRLPKIVVPVHFGGQSCDMRSIRALSRKYGFSVIEDASHAIGGQYLGDPIGNCRFSDITVFSFHPVKIITAGEGGMALTNSPGLAESMSLARAHGITRDPARMTHASDGPWYYQQIALGYNYRMTDVQAALGVSQLGRIEQYVATRRELAGRYDGLLQDKPLTTPWRDPNAGSAMHLYVVRLHLDRIKNGRLEVFNFLRDRGIGVNVLYIPIHTQPYFRNLGTTVRKLPEAERYYKEALTLPLYPILEEQEQDLVVEALTAALSA